jgi:hypothetical protein
MVIFPGVDIHTPTDAAPPSLFKVSLPGPHAKHRGRMSAEDEEAALRLRAGGGAGAEAEDEVDEEEDQDQEWDDWESDAEGEEPTKSLFGADVLPSPEAALAHDKERHGFDLRAYAKQVPMALRHWGR